MIALLVLILLAIAITLGGIAGYLNGSQTRQSAISAQSTQSLEEQYQLGLQDLAEGRYAMARQRFEFVLSQNPGHPGAVDDLAEAMSILYATSTPSSPPLTLVPTPTFDTRPIHDLFSNAATLFNSSAWSQVIDTFASTYNPPYYPRLVESCGFTKEKDLLAFLVDDAYRPPEWLRGLSERIAKKRGLHTRSFRLKDMDSEFALIKEIYNAPWSDNWGFVPLIENELREMQKYLVRIGDPDLAFFVYCGDDPAGVCVFLPDINPLLKRFNGRVTVCRAFSRFSCIACRSMDCGVSCFGSRKSTGNWDFDVLGNFHLPSSDPLVLFGHEPIRFRDRFPSNPL